MPLPGIEFSVRRPLAADAPTTRADVAMVAGLIARRPAPPPDSVIAALAQAGWREGGTFPVGPARLESLLGIPVAVTSWAEFDALFDWRSRPTVEGSGELIPCPLGLAVRQFFLEGGAKAWIVRCGDPLALAQSKPGEKEEEAFRDRQLTALAGPGRATEGADPPDAQPILPGFQERSDPAVPLDRSTWRGAALVFAVSDAAMLLLPDLPDIAAGPATLGERPPPPPGPPEQFRPCAPADGSTAAETPAGDPVTRLYRAPRLGTDGYVLWSRALRYALDLLGRPRGPEHRRDIMLVSALPVPDTTLGMPHGAEQWPLSVLGLEGTGGPKLSLLSPDTIGIPRLQLAYPWLATPDSATCPEGLQSPEGALAGLLARTSLKDGAFRSAAGRPLVSAAALSPRLAPSDIGRGLPGSARWLGDRLCLFAERGGAIELVSDSTAADDRAWRSGPVSRLVAILLRACRNLGDELLFEPSGPILWARTAALVTAVLEQLRAAGAFEGLTPADCYQVTCDRSTMTDADIDAGRLRCEVVINPASPIERIVVTLSLVEPVPTLVQEAA